MISIIILKIMSMQPTVACSGYTVVEILRPNSDWISYTESGLTCSRMPA